MEDRHTTRRRSRAPGRGRLYSSLGPDRVPATEEATPIVTLVPRAKGGSAPQQQQSILRP